MPIITSVALITATTSLPWVRPSASADSFVIAATTFAALMSTVTSAITEPRTTDSTFPDSWFRALVFMAPPLRTDIRPYPGRWDAMRVPSRHARDPRQRTARSRLHLGLSRPAGVRPHDRRPRDR